MYEDPIPYLNTVRPRLLASEVLCFSAHSPLAIAFPRGTFLFLVPFKWLAAAGGGLKKRENANPTPNRATHIFKRRMVLSCYWLTSNETELKSAQNGYHLRQPNCSKLGCSKVLQKSLVDYFVVFLPVASLGGCRLAAENCWRRDIYKRTFHGQKKHAAGVGKWLLILFICRFLHSSLRRACIHKPQNA